jgi:hypothetical protein
MRLVTFLREGRERIGAQTMRSGKPFVLDLNAADPKLPSNMKAFLAAGESALAVALENPVVAEPAHPKNSERTIVWRVSSVWM